jgi:hypothetical protein
MKRASGAPHKPEPIRKDRTILFSQFPPGQVLEASDYLSQMDSVAVEARDERKALDVAYDLREHSLQALESGLEDKGYHLDNTLMSKMMRALIYYVEETQLHNLDAPDRPMKRSQSEAYTHAWERHPHGDHDDTPPEWREYK